MKLILSSFDRVLSIEMFEHMKNYEYLLQKVSKWLKPEGKLFIHIFCHKSDPYDMAEGNIMVTTAELIIQDG